MKKLLLVLVSLMLCCSLLLVGCKNNKDELPAAEPPAEEDDGIDEEAIRIAKDNVIQSFNKIDLANFFENAFADIESTEVDFTTIAAEGNVMMTWGSEAMGAGIFIKDGLICVTTTESDGNGQKNTEDWVYFDGTTMVEFYEENGQWSDDVLATITPASDEDIDALLDMLKKLTVPALKEEQLTVEGDMVVIDNSYISDVVSSNAGVISELMGEEEPTDADKAEIVNDVMESVNEMGLSISVAAKDGNITKMSVNIVPTEEGSGYKRVNVTVTLTDDAKKLSSIEITTVPENPYDEITFEAPTTVKITPVESEGEVVGMKTEVVGYSIGMGTGITSDNGSGVANFTSTVTYEKMSCTAVFDNTKDAFVTLDMTTELQKAFKVEGTEDADDNRTVASVTDVTATEMQNYSDDMVLNIAFSFDDENEAKIIIEGTIVPNGNTASTIDIEGYFDSASSENFPEAVPQYVTDYVNGLNSGTNAQ